MKRWLLVTGSLVVVLGLLTAGVWAFADHRTTPPASQATQEVKAVPCDTATADTLLAAYKPEADGARYSDIKCAQNRYVLARAHNEQRPSDDLIAVFEFKDDAWRKVVAGTDVPCGQVPKEVWQKWDFPCQFEPVICRDDAKRVTVLKGWVDCPAAIDLANRYDTAIKAGQAAGQGLFWESGGWSCSWPDEAGLAHAQIPLRCGRESDDALVQIGDYQR